MYKVYTTKELIDRATKKPDNYSLCFNKECALRSTCHRAIEAEKNKDDSPFIRCVNPAVFPKDGEKCPVYSDSRVKVKYAIGFHKQMDAINQITYRVYRTLHSMFSNTHYYDMLNGNTLITPEEQETIIQVAAQYGYTFPPDGFDLMVEGEVW